MSDTTIPSGGEDGAPKHRKGDETENENPFEDADLDISDFGENPDTETTG